MTVLAAVCQMRSTADGADNLRQAEELVRTSAARGATFVATPENTNYLGPHAEKVRLAETLDGPTCSLFSQLAHELSIHLLLGMRPEEVGVLRRRDEGRAARRRGAHQLFRLAEIAGAIGCRAHLADGGDGLHGDTESIRAFAGSTPRAAGEALRIAAPQ